LESKKENQYKQNIHKFNNFQFIFIQFQKMNGNVIKKRLKENVF